MENLGLEVRINEEETINLDLDGVVSIIVLFNRGETNITVSGLRGEKEETRKNVLWLDKQLNNRDNVNIKLNKLTTSPTLPKSIIEVNKKEENQMKIKRYYALKKDLEDNNLL